MHWDTNSVSVSIKFKILLYFVNIFTNIYNKFFLVASLDAFKFGYPRGHDWEHTRLD